MVRLCFRRRDTSRLVAEARVADPSCIPAAGDVVFAPAADFPGAYAHLLVLGRGFYYDQAGGIALVNLECTESPAPVPTAPGWPFGTAPVPGVPDVPASPGLRTGHRRLMDPTADGLEFAAAEREFMLAMEEYKRRSGRMFPTWSEILEVLARLGYEKVVG